MGVSYTCDRCGKSLRHAEKWTATVRRVGSAGERKYLLCSSCMTVAAAALHMAVEGKGE